MNPLRADPTRTTTLRREYMAAMARRFASLRGEITRFVAQDDAFGLEPVVALAQRRQYQFDTNDAKVQQFMVWLQGQIDAGILETDARAAGNAWQAVYVENAYRKGTMRAYDEVKRGKVDLSLPAHQDTARSFASAAFAQIQTVEKLQLLGTRNFELLRGVTGDMSGKISRVLVEGLTQGLGPRAIARLMAAEVDGITRKRALVIARTEIIHAHAEAMLDGFERLGVEDIGLLAEWSTAGNPCPLCAERAGSVMTIAEARGLIPLHPNCRCMWIPFVKGLHDKGK